MNASIGKVRLDGGWFNWIRIGSFLFQNWIRIRVVSTWIHCLSVNQHFNQTLSILIPSVQDVAHFM